MEDGSHHALDLFVRPKPVAIPDVGVCNGVPILSDNGLMTIPHHELGAVKERDHCGLWSLRCWWEASKMTESVSISRMSGSAVIHWEKRESP